MYQTRRKRHDTDSLIAAHIKDAGRGWVLWRGGLLRLACGGFAELLAVEHRQQFRPQHIILVPRNHWIERMSSKFRLARNFDSSLAMSNTAMPTRKMIWLTGVILIVGLPHDRRKFQCRENSCPCM